MIYAPYIIDDEREAVSGSLLLRTLQEVIQVAPWFIAAWLLINLPVLLPPKKFA